MLALLGSLAGFISSFIPEIFNFFKDTKDKKHEIELVKLQIEAMRQAGSSRLDEVYIKADMEEVKHLYGYMSPDGIKGVKWVYSLSALVRPLITYSFFLLYIILKLVVVFGYVQNIDQGICMPIWTDEDQAIFCAVIGFWFGARAFGRSRLHNFNGSNGSVNGKF